MEFGTALGRIGEALMLTDPRYSSIAMQMKKGREEQDKYLYELAEKKKKETALAQIMQMSMGNNGVPSVPGVMGPLQPQAPASTESTLQQLAAADPAYIDSYLNYQTQQNDPLRKIQLASAQAALTEAQNKAKQQKAVQEYLKNIPQMVQGQGVVPASGMGPQLPQAPASTTSILSGLAALDPSYADNYISELSKEPAKPEWVPGMPGYEFKNGQISEVPGAPLNMGVKPTEFQAGSARYYKRMAEAEANIENVGSLGESASTGKTARVAGAIEAIPSFGASRAIGGAIRRENSTPAEQRYTNAAKLFITGVLRKDSGGAITDEEWDTYYPMYFPMPGDSPEVIAQKKQQRAVELTAMRDSAGPAISGDLPHFEQKPLYGDSFAPSTETDYGTKINWDAVNKELANRGIK